MSDDLPEVTISSAPPGQFEPVAPPLTPPTAEGVSMSEPIPAVSPTGKPVIDSQMVIKVAGAVVGIAAVLTQALPPNTVGFKVASAVVAFGAVLGIYSQGARVKP